MFEQEEKKDMEEKNAISKRLFLFNIICIEARRILKRHSSIIWIEDYQKRKKEEENSFLRVCCCCCLLLIYIFTQPTIRTQT